jgi:flagellar biosynthesis protein FlhG
VPQGKFKLIRSLVKGNTARDERSVEASGRRAGARRPQIISIGGGKGGVGKSLLTSNMGVLLSQMDKSVLLVDADLGAANLHTMVGEAQSRAPLSRFLKGEVTEIESVISKTTVPNLDLISGSRDSMDIANLEGRHASTLKNGIMSVDHDYVIMDLGPGTSNNMLDFFLMSDQGVLVLTPEPTSVENTYRFIKCLLLRRMKMLQESDEGGELRELLKKILFDRERTAPLSISGLLDELRSHDQHRGETLKKVMQGIDISLVINQARTPEDRLLGYSISRACADFFTLDVSILGHISYSDSVVESIRSRRPLAIGYAGSEATREIESVLRAILKRIG